MIKIIPGSRIRLTDRGREYATRNKQDYEGIIQEYKPNTDDQIDPNKFWILCPDGYKSGWFGLSEIDPDNSDRLFNQIPRKPTIIIG